jgi:hypothetical protein
MLITAWVDENCGFDGWAMTRSGMRGVPNHALSIYFANATLISTFAARWCVGTKVETALFSTPASHSDPFGDALDQHALDPEIAVRRHPPARVGALGELPASHHRQLLPR